MNLSQKIQASIIPLTPKDCAILESQNIIKPDNPLPCSRLTRVIFKHKTFQGTIKEGQVIVFDAIAPMTKALFSALLEQNFPIHQARPIEDFQGNDNASMEANNSSAFNGRAVSNGTTWSKHAYGIALDINPLQNPYIALNKDGTARIAPKQSTLLYVNRHEPRYNKEARPGMLEPYINLFAYYGFLIWGGEWNYPLDYHHFEVSSVNFVKELLKMSSPKAQEAFNTYVQNYRTCLIQTPGNPTERRIQCIPKNIK